MSDPISAALRGTNLRPVAAVSAIPRTTVGVQPVSVAPQWQRQAQKQDTASPWGGGCPWQYDKTAFKTWLKTAFDSPSGNERKELYGYLSECFLDADGDRDGLIGKSEFNFLIEKAAAMPRRFGLAPSTAEIYGEDTAYLQQVRNQMFDQMDRHRRGKIGMEEWVAFAIAHIEEKVKQIDWQALDFCHLENAGPEQFLSFLATAIGDKGTEQYKALYEFLFKTFVESDVAEKGAITFDQFDVLIEDAAQAPRALGLAPPSSQTYSNDSQKRQARLAMFQQMDVDSTDTITFDKFLNWSMAHIAVKVSETLSANTKKDSTKYGRVAQKQDESSPWGGGCPWQYDKTAFKSWVQKAMDNPKGGERKELYGYLSECFLDADDDRDGLVAFSEFNFLIEKAAAMPRRFGLAPSNSEMYGDNAAQMQQVRRTMFDQMDKRRRGKIGMEEWVAFAIAHISEKVKGINWGTLDFCHLEKSSPSTFVKFLEQALADKASEQYKSLYEFLFKTFVESDVEERGAISLEQFDILIEDAAQAPRALGLAPTTEQAYSNPAQKRQARQREFQQMDVDRAGVITFDKFLNWCLTHVAAKIQEYRANGGR